MKITVAGASGKMGRSLLEGVMRSTDLALSGALDIAGSPALGRPAGELAGMPGGPLVTADLDAGLSGAQCLIDFTRPAGTLAHLAACRKAGVAMVIGTTGFTQAQKDEIAAAASGPSAIPIVFSPNMAVGVNATFKLAEVAARILGDDFDVEIIEAHHRHKVDAPSGTALRLGEAVAGALGRDLAKVAVHGREGETGARERKTIGFHAIRGGDIIGDHTVVFAGEGERVEITIRSQSRTTYAAGALRAARFLEGRKPGLYDMADVLGLK